MYLAGNAAAVVCQGGATVLSPSVLRERDTELLAAERGLAERLDACLRRFESSAEDAETLCRVTLSLQEPFLLVVAGEFNAGKSAFINTLVGEQVRTEGVTPTTAVVTLLRQGETPAVHQRPDGIEERLRDALAPYTRFVRIERERVDETITALDQIQHDLEGIRRRVA